MRVVVNQLSALGRKTGIGHYASELLRCLHDHADGEEIEGFAPAWIRRGWQFWHGLSSHLNRRRAARNWAASSRNSVLSGIRQRAFHQVRQFGRAVLAQHFRAVCQRKRYDLYHEPNYVPLACELPTIATLADLSVLLHPQWHPADRVAYYERYFHDSVRRCVHFLAISEFGRQEIIRHLGVPPEKVTCTYMGIRPTLRPLPADEVAGTLHRLGLPPRYLLYLGTIEPRKNLLTLLRAYCDLPAGIRSRCPLLLVGGWGWNTAEIAEYLHEHARQRGVVHVGYVPEEYLASIYNGARALVYPSFYEGFGLPPAEMLACGGAVLASTAAAIAETVGGHAHLIDARDVAGWRDAMARVAEDDDWWQALRRGATGVCSRFTWERCAADTLQVYRGICGHSRMPQAAPLPRAA